VKADDTYYTVMADRLSEQRDRINSLDAKVTTAFGFSAAMLPLFGALLAISHKQRPPAAVDLYFAAMGVYIFLLGYAVAAYRVSSWSFRPDLETFQANCTKYDDSTMREWVGDEALASINDNEPVLSRKAAYVKQTFRLVALDALLLTIAALIAIR
jgi:hypothetical protein